MGIHGLPLPCERGRITSVLDQSCARPCANLPCSQRGWHSKNSSLKLDLDDIESHGTFDPNRARSALDKANAAIKETSGHHNLLIRWRNSLMRRLREGR